MVPSARPEQDPGRATVRTFLIADIRGYTSFTREHGDEAAGRLAGEFAEIAREAAAARGGEVLELRGDEALAVFPSPAQAVRAAVELLEACSEEMAEDPTLPLTVGVGVDHGEAVPVEGGYRGRALNTAARLCSKAVAGEVLVTSVVAEAETQVEEVQFEEHGALELKGFDAPVEVMRAVRVPTPRDAIVPLSGEPLPGCRWSSTPSRGWWTGSTSCAGSAGHGGRPDVEGDGFCSSRDPPGSARRVSWPSLPPRSTVGRAWSATPERVERGPPSRIRAVQEAELTATPTLLVLDDVDVLGQEVVALLDGSMAAVERRPVMVVATFREAEGEPALASLVERTDGRGDAHRGLPPLGASAVEEVARLYTGEDVVDLPLESVLRASRGVPARVHEVVSDWARSEASRRLAGRRRVPSRGKD